jgi:hypothetical protein
VVVISEKGKIYIFNSNGKTLFSSDQLKIQKKEKVLNAEMLCDSKWESEWILIIFALKKIYLKHFVKNILKDQVSIKSSFSFDFVKSLETVLFCANPFEIFPFHVTSSPLELKPLNKINFGAQRLMVHQNKLIAINASKITVYSPSKNVTRAFYFIFSIF